jgi:dihydrofolate reductase
MGRKTYDVARASGAGAYPAVANYVFSRTLVDDPEPNVRLVRDDAATFVRQLKEQEGQALKGGCVYALYRVRA